MLDEALFKKPCHFVAGAASAASLPPPVLPEMAFAGRSNVGKSSLLNALVQRRDLAHVSAQPGRTQQINFYDLQGQAYLVDMPGHGYARISKSTAREWSNLIHHYLRYRPTLKRVWLLVDPKAGLKESDLSLMSVMDKAALSYQIVLTKIDRLNKEDLAVIENNVALQIVKHPAAHPEILRTSSLTNEGIDRLREEILQLLQGTVEASQ